MIAHVLCIAALAFGVHAVTRTGQLFGSFGSVIRRLGWLAKPITECPMCMAGSVWCAVYWLALRPCPWYHLPLLSLMACGFAGYLSSFITFEDAEEEG